MQTQNNNLLELWKDITRILIFCVREFRSNRCDLRASALTLLTLMTIVPIMAMAFGIAKGFGFQKAFEQRVYEVFAGQEQIISNILEFSTRTLEKTQGGLMAVLGLLLLFYALIKLIGHIENALNSIFCIEKDRTWIRKFTDYIAITITAGFLSFFSGYANIFVRTLLNSYLDKIHLMESVEKWIRFGFELFPFISIWVLFIFIYIFIPNKKMNMTSCLAGGIIAGTIFQLIQILYLKFQVGVSTYNAIYGSFAALPLFLIWLQASWLIILLGAVIIFAMESAKQSSLKYIDDSAINIHSEKLAALAITLACVKTFAGKAPALDDMELSRKLDIPLKYTRKTLKILVSAGILSKVVANENTAYAPAQDISQINVSNVLEAFEHQGSNFLEHNTNREIQAVKQILTALDTDMNAHTGQTQLTKIA